MSNPLTIEPAYIKGGYLIATLRKINKNNHLEQ